MSTNVWDDPAAQVGGDYATFVNVGDNAKGEVTEVRLGTDFAGNPTPELVLKDGDVEKIVTAGQVRLKVALLEQRPAKGDHVSVTLESIENRPGGRTMKHFKVDVTKAGGAAPASPSVSAPAEAATPATDPAAAAAALAALSPEQRKALGL